MHYVIIGEHSPETCPTSNARTRELLLDMAPQIPKIAEKNSVNIVSGPFVNREHVTVVIVEASSAEDLDRFLVEARLPQWNRVRILPSLPMKQGVAELNDQPALF